MQKIFISSILVLLFSISVFAKESYIQVMSISDLNYLNGVKNKINNLGYKTYINKRGKWHIVYAGPFKNSKKANKALSRVKKSISKDAFLTKITATATKKTIKKQTPSAKKKTAVPSQQKKETKKVAERVLLEDILPVKEKAPIASIQVEEKKKVILKSTLPAQKKVLEKEMLPVQEILVQTEKKETVTERLQEENILVQPKKEKGFYIGLAAGISMVDVEQSGSEPVILELEDSGMNYSAEIGYYFNNNIFISINYQKTDLEKVSLSSVFTTLNYQLDDVYSISPYVGAIVGYSKRTWEESPTLLTIDTVSSLLGGLQIGSDIALYDDLSLYFYYRYLIMDTTSVIYDITPGEKKIIEYSNEQDLNMGIKYNF